jgi:hypothetical protein
MMLVSEEPVTVADRLRFAPTFTAALVGEIEMLTFCETGSMVTVAEANFEGSSEETAVTVTVLPVVGTLAGAFPVVGTVEGAVYLPILSLVPDAVTVPIVALPPGMPFTSQITEVFPDPTTSAVKVKLAPTWTFAVVVERVTA